MSLVVQPLNRRIVENANKEKTNMNVRTHILLLTFLLAWLGGIGNLWAGTSTTTDYTNNGKVGYGVGSNGFDIKFKKGDYWYSTTFGDGGYYTYISFDDGNNKQVVNGSSKLILNHPYTIGDLEITISVSIPDPDNSTVRIQYTIKNNNPDNDISIKLGSCADTQVGDNDGATVSIEQNQSGQKYIVMKDGAAEYKISAGLGDYAFTRMWYGAYSGNSNGSSYTYHVFDSSDNAHSSGDTALAWSWDITIPKGATVRRYAGGGEDVLSPQTGDVVMADYTYGDTPSTPSVSNVQENPAIVYYYNTTNTNSGGTQWTQMTGTSLNAGTFYMYAKISATTNYAAYTTEPTAFTVNKRALTIRANNHSITYGQAPTNNGVVYTGFAAGQDQNNLSGGLTYTYNYSQYGNVGTYTITPSGLFSYNYDITFQPGTLTVQQKEVGLVWTNTSFTYNISEQKPTATATGLVNNDVIGVTVTGGRTNAGTGYTATASELTGTKSGNYKLPAANTVTFTILPKPITSNDITVAIANAIYTGQTQTPLITIKYGIAELINNTDYTISYKGSTLLNAQTYASEIIITGTGNYTGTRQEDFTIYPKDINLCTVEGNSVEYTGSNIVPGSTITVKDGTTTLNTTSHYTLTVSNAYTYKEPNTYANAIAINGKGNYTGTKNVDFKVTKALNGTYTDDFTISAVPTQIYDGTNAVNPSVSLFDKGILLTKGTHYTITYGGNNTEGVNAGTITITGLDSYAGSKSFHFDIVNEYFTESNITYHATSSTTVAIGNHQNVATTLTGTVEIPATVNHVVATPFQVTGIEEGAFKNKTDVTGISMPHAEVYLEYIEKGAFEGCTHLRYIDLCHATSYTPTGLQRSIAASPFYGVPKQALVYLNGTSIIGENYVYKPGDGNDYYCELFKVYDDMSGSQTAFSETNGYQWKFENRHSFTAYTVENTRQLTAGKHYTVCLPYDLPLPSTLQAYTMDGSNNARTLIGFTEVTGTLGPTATPWLPVPYVVIPSVSGQLLNATNTVVHEFKEEAVTNKTQLNGVTQGDFTFYGTMRYMDGNEAAGLYIMQYNNGNPTWMQIAAGSGFNQSNKACILPMRAYIKNTASAAPPYINASFTDASGTTTTVNQLHLDEDDAEEKMYDLSGRQVKTPRKGNLYIINHRIVRK